MNTATELLPSFIKLECPHCHCAVSKADLMSVATIVVRRTCRKCRTCWQVIIRPKTVDRNRIIAVHQLEWTSLGRAS